MNRYGPALVFGLAILIRIAYLIDFKDSPLFDAFVVDADYYDRKAREILSGDWLGGEGLFTLSPLYPYFLAIFYKVTNASVVGVKLIQHVLGACTAAMICRIGIALGGPAAGCLAGFFAATYGLFIFAEGTLENEFLAIFFNVAALWILIGMDGKKALGRAALAGLCVGLSAGIRPNAVLLAVPVLLWFFQTLGRGRAFLVHAALFCLTLSLPILGIAARNAAVTGEWVFMPSTSGAMNLYIGTLAGGGGYIVPDFVRPPHPDTEHEDFRKKAEEEMGRPVTPSEASRHWLRKSLVNIRSDPAAYLRLLGQKFLAFCNRDEAPDNYDYAFGRRYSSVLSLPWTSIDIIFPLALIGACLAARPFGRWTLPWGMLAVYLLTVLLYHQSYRYRLPAVPSLMLFAALAVVWTARQAMARSFLRLALAAVVLAAGVGLNRLHLPRTNQDMDAAVAAGNYVSALKPRGRLDAAAAVLQDSLNINPNYAPNIRKLADVHLERGEFSRAADLYRRIQSVPIYEKDASQNLALCCLAMNDPMQAKAAILRALAAAPGQSNLHYILAETEYKLGRLPASRDALRHALRLNPGYEKARKALEDVEGMMVK